MGDGQGRGIRTTAAASLARMSPGYFRTWASRQRRKGIELRLPPEEWPDARTPLWDADLIRQTLRGRQ